jgi:hypothetical protein
MKEFGCISKAEAEYRKWKEHLIGKEGDYVCSIPACNKIWFPTIEDTNRKRPSTFYKLCRECRTKSYLKGLENKAKIKKNDANMKTIEVEGLDA